MKYVLHGLRDLVLLSPVGQQDQYGPNSPSVMISSVAVFKLLKNVTIKWCLGDCNCKPMANARIDDGRQFFIDPIFFCGIPIAERFVSSLWFCHEFAHMEHVKTFGFAYFVPISHELIPLLFRG